MTADFDLSLDELREVARYAVACAQPTMVIFERACPDDQRPVAALRAAREFADGGPRTHQQRLASAEAHRAGREASTAPTENAAAGHAATAAGDAAVAGYLHPLAKATQVRHILGAAAHAARAAELVPRQGVGRIFLV